MKENNFILFWKIKINRITVQFIVDLQEYRRVLLKN